MEAVQEKVLNILNELIDSPVKDLSSTLADLGLDSLDCLDFLHQVKDVFDINNKFEIKNFMETRVVDVIEQVNRCLST